MIMKRWMNILTRWNRGRQHLGSVCGEEVIRADGGRLNLGWSGIGEKHDQDGNECHDGGPKIPCSSVYHQTKAG